MFATGKNDQQISCNPVLKRLGFRDPFLSFAPGIASKTLKGTAELDLRASRSAEPTNGNQET